MNYVIIYYLGFENSTPQQLTQHGVQTATQLSQQLYNQNWEQDTQNEDASTSQITYL